MPDDGPRLPTGTQTGVSDREYLMAMLHAVDVRIGVEIRAMRTEMLAMKELAIMKSDMAEKQLAIAQVAMDKWQASQNEFRAQSKDKDATFAPLTTMEAKFETANVDRRALEGKLDSLASVVEKWGNRASFLDGRWAVIGVLAVIIIGFALKYVTLGKS